jgi:uncharacterized Zn-finger protein
MGMSIKSIIVKTTKLRNACDGAGENAAMGHPRVWIEMEPDGTSECKYCGKRFVLEGEGEGAH